MNDDHDVVSAVRAAGAEPTAEVRAAIRTALEAGLRGEASLSLSAPTEVAGRRWWVAVTVVAAAAAAAVVGVVMVVNDGDDDARIVPADASVPATAPSLTSPVITEVPAPSTTLPSPTVELDDLVGPRWIVVERDGAPWPLAYLPYLEFGSSGPNGAIDPFLGGNDGCNWYGGHGSLDDGRLQLGEIASTAMDCGPGTGDGTPRDGDVVELSDDGITLTLTGDEQQLVLMRLDALATATTNGLGSRWTLDPGAPFTLDLDADGLAQYGPCALSWSMTSALTVSGWPGDPYSCLGQTFDGTSSRLVELLVGGPVDARLSADGGQLFLSDDQFVIRLAKNESDPVPDEPAAVDMLAGWQIPPTVTPDLAAVPRLLPAIPTPGATEAVRTEYADDPFPALDYTQTFVGGDQGESLLVITTNVAQHHDPVAVTELIDVGSWDTAFVRRTSADISSITLDDPSGLVDIWATGMSADEITSLAGSLVPRIDGQTGWWSPTLDESYTLVDDGWGTGVAKRTVRWNAGLVVAELNIVWGSPISSDPWSPGAEVSVTDVRGAPALTFWDGTRAAITWSPAPDVTVKFGLYGSLEQALAIVRSIEAVDEATWESASRLDTSPRDDCNSMFC